MAVERFEIVISSRGTRAVQRDIRGIGTAATAVRRTLGFLRAALVVVASARVLRGFFDLADSFTLIRNRLRLVTASTAELNTVQGALFRLSQNTRTAFEANAELFGRLTRSTQTLGLNFQQLLNVTEATALAVKVSGATAQEARNSIIQFAQGLAVGALRGDELRSVAEQFPRLAEAIGREFGIAGGQLTAFAKANEGALTTERIIKALREELGILTDEFDEVLPTITDSFTKLNNALILFVGGLNDATGAGRILAQILDTIADNLDKVLLILLAFGGVIVFNLLIAQLAALNATVLAFARGGVGAIATLLRVFTALLIPISLLTVAINGLGTIIARTFGALIFLARGAFTVLVALVRPVTTLARLFLILRTAVLTNPLFFLGAAALAGLVAAFFLFEDQIRSVIDRLGGIKEIFDAIVAGGIAAIQTLIQAWRRLPAAFADLGIQAANALVEQLEKGVNGAINLLNRFRGIDLEPVELPRIVNAFEGAADEILTIFQQNFEQIREEGGGGIEFLKGKLQELLAFFKQFTAAGIQIDPELLQNLPTFPGAPAGDIDTGAETRARDALERLLSQISPAIDLTLQLADATKVLNDAREAGIDIVEKFGITEEEVLIRVQRAALGVGNAEKELIENQQNLTQAFEDGIITLVEFEQALRDAKLAALEDNTTILGGFQRSILELENSVANASTAAAELLTSAFRAGQDALVEFVQTGEVNLANLTRQFSEFFLRLGAQQAQAALFGGLGGGVGVSGGGFGAGGLIGGLFSRLSGFLAGGQNGLDFTVGNRTSVASIPGIDNRIVAFRARDRERVTVTPPGQAIGGGRMGPAAVFNIQTPNADSFNRSANQQANRAAAVIARANERK